MKGDVISMKIVGFERSDFRAKDTGVEVKGCNVYLAREINPDRGAGIAFDRIYLSDKKAESMGILLDDLIDCDVLVYYSRFGKPERIVPVS